MKYVAEVVLTVSGEVAKKEIKRQMEYVLRNGMNYISGYAVEKTRVRAVDED